jgi:hypothetical protein
MEIPPITEYSQRDSPANEGDFASYLKKNGFFAKEGVKATSSRWGYDHPSLTEIRPTAYKAYAHQKYIQGEFKSPVVGCAFGGNRVQKRPLKKGRRHEGLKQSKCQKPPLQSGGSPEKGGRRVFGRRGARLPAGYVPSALSVSADSGEGLGEITRRE